jgi:hypothetical protein
MEPTIESGIPIPTFAGKTVYPFKTIKIGESFVANPPNSSNFQVYCYMRAKALGRKFVTRVSPDNSVRVWRIE